MLFRSSKKKGEALETYCVNLNKKARDGKIDPVIGRNAEINRAIQVLCRRQKNNPLFVGEAGVGKTAIAEGLAQAIESGEIPAQLQGKRVIALDMPGMLAGTRYRGDFEERLTNTLDEIAAGLTEPEVERLVAIIKSVKADHAMIWIEHIPHALRAVSDRILVLDFGRKVLEGPPAEVMDSAVVREIYMGLKADGVA